LTTTNPSDEQRAFRRLVVLLLAAFALLGFFGREVVRQAPPIPSRFVTDTGVVVATREDVLAGQEVWKSAGGQEMGSVLGHGAYQAPDWTADWLHREATALCDVRAEERFGHAAQKLGPEARAALELSVRRDMRSNTFDEKTGDVVLSTERAEAVRRTSDHYDRLFGGDAELGRLRTSYAMQDVVLPDPARRRALVAFFFWTSWAASTERPGQTVTYTNNWPHEPLVGNEPTSESATWSLASVLLLLAAVAGIVGYRAFRPTEEPVVVAPREDPLARLVVTPSMRAVAHYLGLVVALFCLQSLLGMLVTHYALEGHTFIGIPFGKVLPYVLARTWHVQSAMFWLATAFLAAGLFLAPLVSGHEPRFQKPLVHVLFGLIVVTLFGSFAGQWLSIRQRLDLGASFWVGHQGYEYLDLGRAFQILFFAALGLWLFLVLRALRPALVPAEGAPRTLVLTLAGACIAGTLLFGAGLFAGSRTHLSVAEYFRFWFVHLWVDGFFEVFATATVSLVFARLGLIDERMAGLASLGSITFYAFTSIPGTLHHLYFSGTPVSAVAMGAVFGALAVVPLVLVGIEARRTLWLESATYWVGRYRWPIWFFLGAAFWNLVGGGIFGFMLNPPLSLYYAQGLQTTPLHSHAALFGVHGLFALGLVLFIARKLSGGAEWRDGMLAAGFWAMNGGLVLTIVLSLLPLGVLQAEACIEKGLWFARSAAFLEQPLVSSFRWARLIGESVFLVGVGCFVLFMLGLWTGRSFASAREGAAGAAEASS